MISEHRRVPVEVQQYRKKEEGYVQKEIVWCRNRRRCYGESP